MTLFVVGKGQAFRNFGHILVITQAFFYGQGLLVELHRRINFALFELDVAEIVKILSYSFLITQGEVNH